uniref:C2H2-type domain-containing protein n=1 Tax=Phlebotomus kandelakii TaxID=1109342 RepID=A0A6B2E9P6_9DIPT
MAQPGSPRALSTSGSLVITRTLASGASTSSVSLGRLSDISTAQPLQTLKNIALSIPASQSIDNAEVANTRVSGAIQTKKVFERRSTIATYGPAQPIPRISSANDLKPWTKQQCSKSATTASKMLEQEAIFSPFKCMGSECWYFTTKENDMVLHLKSHDKTSEEQSEQTTVTDTCSWLECSYCDYMAGSTNDLMSHLKKEHLHCEFLCPKCFYRACNVNYVSRHLLVYHGSEAVPIWKIKPDYVVTSILNPVICVKENIKLLTCKICNLKFLNYIHFESHIKDHGNTVFDCIFCLATIRIENMKKHLFCHSIGNFECIYCECAMINKNNLAQHLCDKHPNMSLLYYNREQAQEHADKFKLSQFDNFGPSCVNVKFVTKDSLPKSIHKFPVGISVTRHTPSPQTASPPNKEPPAIESSLPLVISNVVSLNTKPKAPVAPPSSFLVIKDVCTLPKETPSTSGAKPGGSTEPIKTLACYAPATESVEQQGPFAKAMARVIADWVLKSGSSMKDLLRCSEANCDYQANGRGEFLEHVDRSHQNAMLKCPQCVNVFWHSSSSLWNHLETHGQKRYFCFACDFTARSEQLVAEHCTKNAHLWLGYITVLLTNVPDGGVYLLCPFNTSQAKIDTFKTNFVRNIQKSAVSSVTDKRDAADTYGPDDVDKLPTKPVVARNIMCKLCNYKTMIVKNLVRHFDAHQQAVSLPRLDPVNPVPCLSEKNFDKMTNLACSSNMDRSKTNEPAFVVQQKRFVCGVSYCSYITIDDSMLRSHLSTLHFAETSYKCPHCSVELIKGVFSVDTIAAHYRLHGPKLFMCDKCQFMSETTVTVEKHIKGVHSGTGSIYILRDDSKSDAAVSELTVADETLPKKWICSECKETTYLKCDMANHVATLHGHKYQYVCGYCSMGHPTRHYVVDHVKLRHGSTILITETFSAIKGGGSLKKHVESVNFWRRDDKGAKSIRGIPCEASEMPREEEDEEEDEEESDEDFLPDRETLVAVAKNVESELAKRNLEDRTLEDDTVLEQMKQQRVNRVIQCTICGKTTLSALTMQIVHFPDCHPGVPVSTRTIMASAGVEEPKQKPPETSLEITGYLFKCFHCSLSFNTVEEFKSHFVEKHGDVLETPWCLFYVIKTMYCGLCMEVCDSYDVVAKHLLTVHKTNSVIAKSAKESMNCGACNYSAGDDQNLLRHAKLRHTNPFGSNISAKHVVTQIVLEQLLQIQVFPMKRCTACREVICDIDGRTSEEHLRTKHSASVIATFVELRNFTYICSICHDNFELETASLTHTLTHEKSFKCLICNEYFFTYENAEEHIKGNHGGDVNLIQFNWPTEALLKTLMIFPNGLAMSLGELQMTKYRFDETKFKMVRNEVVRLLKITNSELII